MASPGQAPGSIATRFQPGHSGNPGGRRVTLCGLIRRATKDGRELVDFHLTVLRDPQHPLRERLTAAAWLADRGFGKSLERVEVTTPADNVFPVEPFDYAAAVAPLAPGPVGDR